jgi:glycosyltransferase involved in cell wall biosynthesis
LEKERTHQIQPADQIPAIHVLLCPDQPNWAFDNIAKNIEANRGDNRVSKLFMGEIKGSEHILFETILTRQVDVCHVFWREDLFRLFWPKTLVSAAKKLRLEPAFLVKALRNCAFTTSVYDHLFSRQEDLTARRLLFALTNGYTVSSQKLNQIYLQQDGLVPPDAVITDGVDIEHFQPSETRKPKEQSLTLGWAGNSRWGVESQGYDVKGFNSIFKPSIEKLHARDHFVSAKIADPNVKKVDFRDMPKFYHDLDVFVCTSAIEGTPNTVLEAMACGIPIVSSDVGIVRETFGPEQRRFIVSERNPSEFAAKIEELISDEGLRDRLAKENREQIKSWTWQQTCKQWWPFWQQALSSSASPRLCALREAFLLHN